METGLMLQLLDVGVDGTCGSWGNELPVRLRTMHSHWLNRAHKAVILRPITFYQHRIDFILQYGNSGSHLQTSSAVQTWALKCWRVPHHLASSHWRDLLDSYSQQLHAPHLVLLSESKQLRILSKFEDPEYIHTFAAAEAAAADCPHSSTSNSTSSRSNSNSMTRGVQLLFELPRYGLEFELTANAHMVSRDHSGYRLSSCQQLVMERSGVATLSSCHNRCPNSNSSSHHAPSQTLVLDCLSDGCAASSTVVGTSESSDDGSAQGVLGDKQLSDGKVHYTLLGFQQYLVLERLHCSSAIPDGFGEKMLLIPAGKVLQHDSGCSVSRSSNAAGAFGAVARIDTPSEGSAVLQAHKYEIHGRFGHIRASSVLPRLQLAALYAATSSLLPEPTTQMTGAMTAMELIRQSWVNRPLTSPELQHLTAAAAYAGHLAPGLRLLVAAQQESASQLQHLHLATAGYLSDGKSPPRPPALDTGAASEYKLQQGSSPAGWPVHMKLRLDTDEQVQLLGTSGLSASKIPAWKRLQQYRAIDIPNCPVTASYVTECERRLRNLVAAPAAKGCDSHESVVKQLVSHTSILLRRSSNCQHILKPHSSPPYPLNTGSSSSRTPLECMMHEELKDSWQAHHATPPHTTINTDAGDVIYTMQADVVVKRQEVERYLLCHLSHIPKSTGAAAASFRLMRVSSSAPTVALLDLLRCAWLPEHLLEFNPFLSAAACTRLHEGLLLWLQLCVLEDKLARLVRHLEVGAEAVTVLIQELLVHRTWDVALHPKWLVFEVEGQLQIRPAQYEIAEHLMAHPGAIMQLNMGEGKTRVILPMLALHWAADKKYVVRLNFLSTLLHEAYSHLHQHLTASVLGVKLMLMPFHRDVVLTPQTAAAMRAAISHCKRVGGLLLVVPQHRLSLQLKWHELRMKGDATSLAVCDQLQALAAMPYLDMLDESDELLHHRFQLVYACGDREALHARPERVSALQAVLMALTQLADGGTADCPELHRKGVAVWPAAGTRSPGSFCAVQLLAGGPLEAVLPALLARVAATVLKSPSYELRWLAAVKDKEKVLSFLTDSTAELSQLHQTHPDLTADERDQLLTLRGLLALGMLHHCLLKRHNVDYGINRSSTARKQLAVPFRAAHTPSERSEFAQPDVALLLTHLSYYADGLSIEQFKHAVEELQHMGGNAQHDYYSGWLSLLPKSRIQADQLSSFDDVLKVDPTNRQQLELMWRFMKHNMGVVNFWLSFCLLPDQTSQFPQRLSCNAWNLADNAGGHVYGFSGTNDNHRLLPLQVQQADMKHKPLLAATNGKMLDLMLSTATYKTLRIAGSQKGGKPQWQLLLDYALEHKLHALLDCGALLAATTNRGAAEYIRQNKKQSIDSGYQGVCYFDTDQRQWVIDDTQGRRLPRHASPVAEREAFVIFDQARCRGADLQLKQQAVGLLTVAQGVCKDQLMQAAGRMRQLGRGQTLKVVGLPDVTSKVVAASAKSDASGSSSSSSTSVTMKQVLQWVMGNTVKATLHGVTQWAAQGLHFVVTHNAPDRALQQDMLRPEDLYGSSRASRPVADIVADLISTRLKSVAVGSSGDGGLVPSSAATGSTSVPLVQRMLLGTQQQHLLQQIERNAGVYGAGHSIVAGQGVEEECERELEREEEEEEEQQVQVAKVEPAAEQDWDYGALIGAACPTVETVSGQCQVFKLQDIMQMLHPDSLSGIPWSSKVHVTRNFVMTTAAAANWASPSSWANKLQPTAGSRGITSACRCLNEYLRPVSSVLMFPDGDLLLLSEREYEGMLEQIWRCHKLRDAVTRRSAVSGKTSQACGHLLCLGYARLAEKARARSAAAGSSSTSGSGRVQKHAVQLLALPVIEAALHSQGSTSSAASCSKLQSPAVAELVSMHLFNGGAMFDGDMQQLSHLKRMMQGRREAAEALLGMRGKQAMFPRSQLELACDTD